MSFAGHSTGVHRAPASARQRRGARDTAELGGAALAHTEESRQINKQRITPHWQNVIRTCSEQGVISSCEEGMGVRFQSWSDVSWSGGGRDGRDPSQAGGWDWHVRQVKRSPAHNPAGRKVGRGAGRQPSTLDDLKSIFQLSAGCRIDEECLGEQWCPEPVGPAFTWLDTPRARSLPFVFWSDSTLENLLENSNCYKQNCSKLLAFQRRALCTFLLSHFIFGARSLEKLSFKKSFPS